MAETPSNIGAYRLLEELGRGRRTIVYKAVQVNLDRVVALKVLRRHDPETLQRFREEARLSARLNCPGVRRIHEAGWTPEGYIYVAMEFVQRSLKEVLRERFDQERAFTREETAALLAPIAQALDEIHRQGLVHLDIKPDNILVSASGQATLADFGISRQRGETTHEGTPLYLSPEQAAGDRPVGPWCDIYALGALVYEMVTGRPPFVSDIDVVLIRQHLQDTPVPIRKLNPRLDRDLERVLAGALSKDPRERPPTARELLDAVAERRSTPLSAPLAQAETVVRQTSVVLRRRPYLALIPVVLLALIAGAFFLFRPGASAPPTLPPPPPTPTARPTARPTPRQEAPDAAPSEAPRPPTRTPVPTSTPADRPVRPTGDGETQAPASATAPTGLTPNGVELSHAQKVVTFRWQGRLAPGQNYVFELCHYDDQAATCEMVQSARCETESYRFDLPRGGTWRWWVRVEPGGVKSDVAEFWLRLYAPDS